MFEPIRNVGDGEIYQVNNKYYLFVWGFSTGNDLGTHNPFNTDVLVSVWQGEDCKVKELPGLKSDGWILLEGFDIDKTEDDWNDYGEKVDGVLKYYNS